MEPTQTQAIYTPPPIIAEAATLLGQPLPAAAEDREVHLIALDALRYPMAVATTDALKLLYEKRRQVIYPKDTPGMKLTELDRQTNLDAMAAPLERDYELLRRIETLLEQRIALCMYLLGS